MLKSPLRVAVLCSHRAPGLLHLLNANPDRGRTFDIVCCVTSESTFAEEVRVERRGVPTRSHNIRDFYDARKAPLGRAPEVRAAFDAATVDILHRFSPDLVVLAGYLYLLSDPMLAAFKQRILNLHFADLTLRAPDGAPDFPGIRAVRDALAAGCTETRATIHLVDASIDAGPAIVRSWAFPVSPLVAAARGWAATDMLRAYGFAHEQWMMRASAGPLWSAALQLVTGRAIDLDRLGAASPLLAAPWELSRRGVLAPPMAAQPALARSR
jgi:folate-dependent phosphoribosylglycinamide formyltransferase PurN